MRKYYRIKNHLRAKPGYVLIVPVLALSLIVGGMIYSNRPSEQEVDTRPLDERLQWETRTSQSQLGTVSDSYETIILRTRDQKPIGKAHFKEIKNKVFVSIATTEIDTGASMPTYIYKGSCSEPGPPLYSFSPLEKGETENYIASTLKGLKDQFPLALVIHASYQDTSVSACVDLK